MWRRGCGQGPYEQGRLPRRYGTGRILSEFGLVALPATVYGSVTLTNRIRIPEKSPSIAYMVLQRRMERRDGQAVQEGMAMPGPKA